MTDAIQAAIEAAKATAARLPATPSRGTPFSLTEFSLGSMNVDAYLKVKEYGLVLGSAGVLLPEVTVTIDMKEVQVHQAIKFGNPAQYLKTYDGVICVQGGSWDQAQMRARSVDPTARPYMSADIPMIASEDIKTPQGQVLLEKGKRLGHSLSTTNKANFQEFITQLTEAGLVGTPVKVKITAQRRTNQKGQAWGVLTFNLLGAAQAA